MRCPSYKFLFLGLLGNDRDNSNSDGDDGDYDNPVQDHMSDQYSPPDGPLTAQVDPGNTLTHALTHFSLTQ